jgi:uncharacterized SAM-binding protein YcdF (DUF218 family)
MKTKFFIAGRKPITIMLWIFFVLLVSYFAIFAIRAGENLVVSHNFESADLIMVLMGPIPDRVLQTSDLYHRGVADKIVFCNDHQPGALQLADYGIYLENTADIAKKTMLQLGIPDSVIHVFKHATASTQDEAVVLRDYLMNHPEISKVVLVTSSYHSKRTYRIFSKALTAAGLDVQISMSANSYTNFNQKKWWTDRPSATMVLLEHLKLMNFYLVEQHRL